MCSCNQKDKIVLQLGTCMRSQENIPSKFSSVVKQPLSSKHGGTANFIVKPDVFSFCRHHFAIGSKCNSSLTIDTINTHNVYLIFLNAIEIDFWSRRNWALMLHLFCSLQQLAHSFPRTYYHLPRAIQFDSIHYYANIF